jgi:1-acyl-sn-glycerol-3-phosphate acyltransferase
MKNEKPNGIKVFLSFTPTYLAGVFIGACLLILRIFKIWKVNGIENIPTLEEKGDRGLILVSNHPSLLEPIALVGLFAHWYIVRPKLGPWNIAETSNFRRGFFRLMKPRLIFVDRNSISSEACAIRQAKTLLESGAVFIIFPEGGRTYRGAKNKFLTGNNNGKIRVFKGGAGFLAIQTQAIVLPVWVQGTDKVVPNIETARYSMMRFWRPVSIKIGKSIDFASSISVEEATRALEKAVLNLT